MVWGSPTLAMTSLVTDDVLNVCHFLLGLTEEAYPSKHQPFTSFVSKCVTLNLNKTGQCEQPPPFALCSLLLCEGDILLPCHTSVVKPLVIGRTNCASGEL